MILLITLGVLLSLVILFLFCTCVLSNKCSKWEEEHENIKRS